MSLPELKAKSLTLPLPNGCFLRPLQPEDVNEDYIEALNNRSRVQHMTSVQAHNSRADVISYVIENIKKSDVILFGIFEGECLLGTSRLHDIDQVGKTAWMGIFVFNHDPAQKGLGTSVIKKICDFAFTTLHLDSVRAGIFLENEPSVRAFTKAGFSVFEKSVYEGKPYQKWINRRA